jgi:hypothetical protein
MRWSEFEASAPELAALGLDGFRHQNLCLVGTITAEGWPRISPTEVYVVEGELLLGMMPGSRKVHDLLRDPRLTVVTPQAEREPTRGDFKLYGRALDVTDPALRAAYGETIFAAIGWRPSEPFPLFAMDIERAAYIRFGAERRLLRWAPATGVETLRHPDA